MNIFPQSKMKEILREKEKRREQEERNTEKRRENERRENNKDREENENDENVLPDEKHDQTFGIKCCRMKGMTRLLKLSVAGRKA
ncbi:hypothetical protein RclHR1_05310004 [Rhizophagus clarus]|uniref:Uncharacterized protein n=1 Tax=Rhizophagus clarus TaxID=94130 RepID=A0A2Z6SEJ4_9GLOM|nr:hypothetical protein RclHR1_05310004 [Rhizophagus clarus]